MSQIPLSQCLSSHLGIVIRPNFLAAVRRLNEILPDSPPLSHLPGKFLVHQTCREHLEGPSLVLGVDVNNIAKSPEP